MTSATAAYCSAGTCLPKGAAGAKGSFTATLKVSSSKASLAWRLTFTHLTGPALAAHIHLGATVVAGPIVVGFFAAALPDTISSVGGCVHDVDPALIKNIHDNPSEYYVNVHDTDFPEGAIRDQLHPAGKHGDDD